MNSEAWDFLFKVVELGVIPFVIYVTKSLAKISADLKTLRTVLIGIDGKNGIRSRLIRLERRLERLTALEAQIQGLPHVHYESDGELDD